MVDSILEIFKIRVLDASFKEFYVTYFEVLVRVIFRGKGSILAFRDVPTVLVGSIITVQVGFDRL